ncbi:MAG: RES family NAD+ phosphorylase [Ginsengibacter sp.]
MIIYRLAIAKYANDISGEGASIYGGRWNPVGIKALYASQNISLCILEILVRTQKKINPPGYQLITIEFPEANMASIELSRLKPGWKQHIEYTQWIGEEFLKEDKSLVMQVPSVIVDKENNFLINPLHKDFNRVKTISIEALDLDKRLNQI